MALIGLTITVLMKNSMELVGRIRPAWGFCLLLLCVACWSLLEMSKVSEFLYFQF